MRKLLSVFVKSLLICVPGMAVIGVVGVYLSCFFVAGCYQTLGIAGVLGAVSIKGIFVKGTLLALAFTLLSLPKIRSSMR
ncbi:hypothetical protein [Paraburkholderia sp. MM5482-R2]